MASSGSPTLLSAYVDVEDGQLSGCGYTGGKVMGLTPVTPGPLQVMLPTIGHHDIQWQPAISGDEVTFVESAGGRPGFSFLKPTWRWPFLVTKPFTIWTTLKLTIKADGTSTQALIGASPFPRHWLYDDAGLLVQKTALTRNQVWARTAFGSHTPWGGEDEIPAVADTETELERRWPTASCSRAGGTRFATCTRGTTSSAKVSRRPRSRSCWTACSRFASTDGSSGSSVPARSSASGHSSKEVVARPTYPTTEARIAEVDGESLDLELLSELTQGHHREGTL